MMTNISIDNDDYFQRTYEVTFGYSSECKKHRWKVVSPNKQGAIGNVLSNFSDGEDDEKGYLAIFDVKIV